jgi:hypothetical protein
MLAICLTITLLTTLIQPATSTVTGKPLPTLSRLYNIASGPWIITRGCGGIFLMVITAYLMEESISAAPFALFSHAASDECNSFSHN